MKILGLSSSQIVLQPHNREWAQLFEEEAKRLRAVLGGFVLDIQHVGSTSIPGIPAKPILDIAIAVAHFEEASRCLAPIEALGYTYRGEAGIPRRHYFVKGAADNRTHHLHMNEIQSDDWQQQIAFRDILRQHSDLAQEYAGLKLRLAKRFPTDRFAYTESKSGFISRVLNRALPQLLPEVGDTLTVKVFKRDTQVRRSWRATVESVAEEGIVTFDPPGGNVRETTKSDWVTAHVIRAYYWFDRPYNLLEVYRPNGELEEIYVHVASPMVVKNGEILYTDYELDVVKPAGDVATIVDEDEFAEATARYGYSAEFCNHCWETARELVSFVDNWQATGLPNHRNRPPP